MAKHSMRYMVFYFIWSTWHMKFRRFFDYFDARLRGKDPNNWMYACRYAPDTRPHWHMCCNGNAGGWRTNLCDWLEHKWRALDK
jgi:hypothetical protein